MDVVYRMKHVRDGERRSRRKLGLSQEIKAEDLPVRTRRPKVLVHRLVVEVPVLVLMETTIPELPRDLQDATVGTPVARPVVSSPTPDIHLGYGETMEQSSTSTPPSPNSLWSRGERNNRGDVYGLQQLLGYHLHHSGTRCFNYHTLTYEACP
jgi:hypothetical protein